MDLYEITRAGTVNGEAWTFTDYVVASSLANAASIHAELSGGALSIRELGSVLAVEADGPEVDTDAVSQIGFRLQEDDEDDGEQEADKAQRLRKQAKARVASRRRGSRYWLP